MIRSCSILSLLAGSLLLGALSASPLSAQPATEARPDERVPSVKELDSILGESWYGLYVQGKKIGFMHVLTAKKGTAELPTYVTSTVTEMKILASGTKATMRSVGRSVFSGKAPYPLLAQSKVSTARGQERSVVATRKGAGFEIVIRAGGSTQTQRVKDFKSYTLADSMSIELWIRSKPKLKATCSSESLDLDEWSLETETATITGIEERVVKGVKATFYRLSMSSPKNGAYGKYLVNAKGEMVQAKVFDQFELRMEPKELAQKTEFSTDLFELGTVPLEGSLGEDPKLVTRMELEVRGKGHETLQPASHQQVKHGKDATILVVHPAGGNLVKASAKEIKECLRETPDVPTKHPEIVALAKQAVGSAKTPREKVERLVHFVSAYVEDDSGSDAVSVLEVVRTRRGDCTEHTELFTALARAAGIPTREVSGLMYMGDSVRRFGGHAWNEVVLDGKWVPVDSTWDEVQIDATHVRLSDDQKSVQLGGKLRFKLVKAEKSTK